jgi:fucose permease
VSMIVPLVCYFVVAFFAFWGTRTATLSIRSGRLLSEVQSEYKS